MDIWLVTYTKWVVCCTEGILCFQPSWMSRTPHTYTRTCHRNKSPKKLPVWSHKKGSVQAMTCGSTTLWGDAGLVLRQWEEYITTLLTTFLLEKQVSSRCPTQDLAQCCQGKCDAKQYVINSKCYSDSWSDTLFALHRAKLCVPFHFQHPVHKLYLGPNSKKIDFDTLSQESLLKSLN